MGLTIPKMSDKWTAIVIIYIYTIVGAITIVGLVQQNEEAYRSGLMFLGISGAGFILKGISNNLTHDDLNDLVNRVTFQTIDNIKQIVKREDSIVDKAIVELSNALHGVEQRINKLETMPQPKRLAGEVISVDDFNKLMENKTQS